MVRKYFLRERQINKNYENASASLPLCPCLVRLNSEKKGRSEEAVMVRFEPRYTSVIDCFKQYSNGEREYERSFRTDSFKKTNGKKWEVVNTFFSKYRPLYRSKNISLFGFTFTQANEANKFFSDMLDNIRYRFKANKIPVKGYVWRLEVTEGLHWHYHLCVATTYTKFNSLDMLKFNKTWGQHTQVRTVDKVFGKQFYMTKKQPKIDGFRSYGYSTNFQ